MTPFRIDAPAFPHRSSRVIALDPGAAAAVAGTEHDPLRPGDVLPGEELDGADTVVLVASPQSAGLDGTRAAASAIGDAAAARGITTVGIVLPGGTSPDPAVSALRPNAMVLLILRDATDLPEILSALRV
ncbi:MAG: hypothetical protein FWE35_05285 [Streptosporangiales bacterium]|jgi:hypothetical protein|nr:hypothetical protein [Streptosporangiales bacterium]